MVHWNEIDFDKVDKAELDVGLYWVKLEVRLSDKFSFIYYFTDKAAVKYCVHQWDGDEYEAPVHVVGVGVASFNEFGMLCPYITEETAQNDFDINKIRYSVVRRYSWCDIYFDHVYYFKSLPAKKEFERKFNTKPSTIRFLMKGGITKVKYNTLYPKGIYL